MATGMWIFIHIDCVEGDKVTHHKVFAVHSWCNMRYFLYKC